MTREDAATIAARLLGTPIVLCWSETSADHPLWSAADEVRQIEVRYMKTGDYLRRRVSRTRTSAPTPVLFETHHRPDWLAMTLEQSRLTPAELVWRARGTLAAPPRIDGTPPPGGN